MNRSERILLPALLLTASVLLAPLVGAADQATLARDTELRAKPLGDAAVVAPLKSKTAVTIVSRSGAWAQVTTGDGKTGYVRMLNLRTGSSQKGDSGIGALANVFRTGSSGNSVATGVKGMSEEDLTGATPSPEAVEHLSHHRASEKAARNGAKSVGLKAKEVAYLAAPGKDAMRQANGE